METVLSTVLSTVLFLSTAIAAPATSEPQQAFTRVLAEQGYVGYIVEKEDSLDAIAEKAYGSDEYWTTVWNDNAWIADPEVIAKDTVIRVRVSRPNDPMELASVLAERNNAVLKQKNEAYLKQIGYLSAEAPQPTIMPTIIPIAVPAQTQPAAMANVPQSLSEEALTYLGNCEAGMNPTRNTGNGYYGAFQFSQGTWNSMNTGYARADLAPLEVQKAAVQRLLARSSIYNQFPGCAKKMRSAGLI